jgi:6-phosphogluconolactonase
MNTDLAVDAAAEGYEQDIRGYFVEKPICFDFILLGLGDNSHTASLFPHTFVLHEKEALVKGLYIDEVKMNRITLTAPVINRGAIIAFLVYGGGKAEAIHHILEDAPNIEEYPAQLIHPEKGEIVWVLDEPAAANLSVDLKKRN